jgi:integrase
LAEDKQEEIGKSDADKTYQTFQIEPQGAKNTDINIQISLLTDLLKRDDFTKLKLSNWRTLSDQDRKTYLHEAKTILLDYLKTHQSALTKAHTLLIQWALQLLEKQKDSRERRKSKAPLAVSSVHTYLHRIGTILLIASDDEDLLALKPPDLGVIYEKAVNQKKSENSKIDAIGNLYQFHGYLESVNDDFEEVDFDEIKLNFGLKVRNVKAKIITLSTYQKALKLLGWGQKDLHRRNKIQISILILAFKCGLRYGEIVSLRVFDYQYGPLPVLLIRNHRFHNNKSDRARRLLPLKELLNEHEFEFVKNYFEYRLREYKHMNNELLFGELTKTGGVVHCGELVQPIVDTIRTITGDMKLSFHSLRHSFATWFTVRLMLREDNKQGFFFQKF